MKITNENSSSDEQAVDTDPPSKSQRKRDAIAVRGLGVELAELSDALRAKIPLPDHVLRSIRELNSATKNGARKRLTGYLAKQLRHADLEAIETALEGIRQAARAQSQTHHLVEQWRDRLLGLDDAHSSSQVLTEFLQQFPHADRQQIRQLQRRAINEQKVDTPPRATRQLFRQLRETIDGSVEISKP